MGLTLTLLLFLAGILLIIKGGDLFVDSASWIAEVSGIPKFVVGATIVSVATTMPEVLVSTIAALNGKVDMAIGNAVGSVTVNTAVILSISILFSSLPAGRKQYQGKCLLLLAAAIVVYLASLGGELALWGNLALVGIFLLFVLENLKVARAENQTSERVKYTKGELGRNLLCFLLGAAGIVVGSRLLVNHGSTLATYLGVPERVIALTLISIGTSLPELVTAISSLLKRETGLSAGNVIGANILDLALVLPVSSAAYQGNLPISSQSLRLDLPFCILISVVAILPVLFTEKFHKWQGALMVGLYAVYLYLMFSV